MDKLLNKSDISEPLSTDVSSVYQQMLNIRYDECRKLPKFTIDNYLQFTNSTERLVLREVYCLQLLEDMYTDCLLQVPDREFLNKAAKRWAKLLSDIPIYLLYDAYKEAHKRPRNTPTIQIKDLHMAYKESR